MGNASSLIKKFSIAIGLRAQEARVLLIGLDSAGKTTILYKMKLDEPLITTIPTIGFNVESFKHKNVEIVAWDIGGRDKSRSLMRHYFENTQAIVYVIDSNDRDRIENVRDEIHSLAKDVNLRDSVLLVLANKQDLSNALTVQEVKQLIRFNEITVETKHIIGSNAISGDGLNEGFDWLSDALTGDLEITKPLYETVQDVKNIGCAIKNQTQESTWTSYFYNFNAKVFSLLNVRAS